MSFLTFYHNTPLRLSVKGLKDFSGTPITNAVLTVEFFNKQNVSLSSVLNFSNDGGGDYHVDVPSSLVTTPNKVGYALIIGTVGGSTVLYTHTPIVYTYYTGLPNNA